MLCNWSAKANVIIPRTVAFRRNATTISLVASKSRASSPEARLCLSPTSSHHPFSSTPRLLGAPALPQPRSNLHPSVISSLSAPAITPSPFAVDHLSPSQISRASATAIRISLARGSTWDAFHLWHSLNWSAHHYHEPVSNSLSRPPFRKPTTAFVPIDFGQPVSTRFAGHCLLHGLLRAGETKTAAMLAEQMMANGEELRPLSFEVLLRQLHPSANQGLPRTIYDRFRNRTSRKMPLGPGVLDLQNVMPNDPFLSFAVRLLSKAREHRWQRTAGMYESVLRACLVQGEILVASLLLVLLLKDYQLRLACSRVAAEAERVGAPDTMAYVHSKLPDTPSRGFRVLPYRSSRYLYQSVTYFLEKHCVHVDDPLFPEASQALAILASALDARSIPYAGLATLIKVLYSYPQCRQNVWVTLPSGERQSLNAYRYFHRVLFDLLRTLPDSHSCDVDTGRLPELNLESYNALLNYAIRFRHSLTLADRLLHHMSEIRKPRLAPCMDTYNTLLRGSTLLRRNDLAESILRVMRRAMSGSQIDIFIPHFPLATPQEPSPQIKPPRTDLPGPHHRRFRGLIEDTRQYELTIPKPKAHLEPDNVLRTTYMAHLVATGRPDAVAALIVRAIPELEPPERRLLPEEHSARWSAGIEGGVTLGPHFFAAALNALRKAGRRGFAERVWALARAAEAKSLEQDSTTPWCLSVHAYTAMLQLYADETRGRHAHGRPQDFSHKVTSAEQVERLSPRRARLGLQKGMLIYRSLRRAAEMVREAVMRGSDQGREGIHSLEPPTADARFFNAALSLVSRQPGMSPRSSRPGSHWRWNRLLRAAHERFSVTGRKPHGWTPELEEIAKGVESAGYALPIGFSLRLVGRDAQVVSQGKMDLSSRPYSFGKRRRQRFAPHRIPTVKRKGLPVRGRWRHLGWPDKEGGDAREE
ncbi:hypothetical protein EDB92DRAFT_1881386 [Lactarius akahatsu]|uniref:Pentatricopeptide repeat domain-containing protein n=1 Tax=Lactarius akahatsu TaxID=416441 RepID=A0AAD4QB04_9AGAM|nr:hypothetical protein EDB92DRAFT_1881386 [Lactarius akahatsu]